MVVSPFNVRKLQVRPDYGLKELQLILSCLEVAADHGHIFYFVQCWAKTASPCIPPCSTHTCTWSARMPRASPTSGSHSSWIPPAAPVPANQRRPECGIAAMASGLTSTSTALERLLHHYSDQVHILSPHKSFFFFCFCITGLNMIGYRKV